MSRRTVKPGEISNIILWLFALLLLFLTGCSPAGPEPAMALEPCLLAGNLEAQCGTLTVPVDHEARSGPTLDLNVAVVPARDRLGADDPLFYLPGGPGQAASETYPLAAGAFQRVNETRDIVLVDQRGTGESNPLTCPVLDDELDLTIPDLEQLREEARNCLDALAGEQLQHYTTAMSVGDLEAVRQALAYETVNLYGGSYGTRLALAYLRDHPERVRALILDGVVSPDYFLFLDTPQDAEQALNLIFARCASTPACDDAFPNLQEKFLTLLEQLAEAPATVTMAHPVTGEEVKLEVDRDTFPRILFSISYSPEFVSLLPLLLTEAYESGDLQPLVAQALVFNQSTGIYEGLFYSVACTEDAPYISLAEAEAAAEGTYFGPMAGPLLIVCEEWPQGARPDAYRQPLPPLETPTLLLSGEADPVTPPHYANALAETLSNSRHLVAPGQGHIVADRGCIPQIVVSFLADADPDALDTTCIATIEPPPFFLNYLGPGP